MSKKNVDKNSDQYIYGKTGQPVEGELLFTGAVQRDFKEAELQSVMALVRQNGVLVRVWFNAYRQDNGDWFVGLGTDLGNNQVACKTDDVDTEIGVITNKGYTKTSLVFPQLPLVISENDFEEIDEDEVEEIEAEEMDALEL